MSFGKAKNLSGKAVSADSSAVPLHLLDDLKRNAPIPITISGTNNVVFTVNASQTNPVRIWNGDDYISLKESKAYTFTSATNNVLNASTGAETTQTATTASTIYYFYLGLDSSGNIDLLPSTAAPSYVEGPYESGHLCHPGTARGQYWNYVGFASCNVSTPSFNAMTKVGYTYHMASTNVATTSTWAELDFSERIPKHGALGVTVGGFLETGAEDDVIIGSTSTNTLGIQKASIAINTTTHTAVLMTPFSGVVPTANGKVYAADSGVRGDVHLSQVVDVV
jgi:hypothetical protein